MNYRAYADARKGFTIVELLIVIVVIVILATVTIVGYNGIQNRANDVAIKNDLTNMAKKAKMYHAEHGEYPTSWGFFNDSPPGISISKPSYDTSRYNLYYCINTQNSMFGIAARSKSGQTFIISSNDGIRKNVLSPQWQVACGAFGETNLANVEFLYGYNLSQERWLYDL